MVLLLESNCNCFFFSYLTYCNCCKFYKLKLFLYVVAFLNEKFTETKSLQAAKWCYFLNIAAIDLRII